MYPIFCSKPTIFYEAGRHKAAEALSRSLPNASSIDLAVSPLPTIPLLICNPSQ